MDRKKKIGVVLNRYPVLSETFIKTFLNHLKDFDVYLFANLEQAEVPFRSSRVLPYLHRIPKSYEFWSYLRVCFLVFWRIERLLKLRRDGLSLKQILVNANIWTTAKLDVLHFPFANLIFQRAQFAAVVGAKQTLSFRGSDINVYPLFHNLSYATVWPVVDKVQCNSVELSDKLQMHNIPKDMPVHIIPSALRPALNQAETLKELEWEAPWQFLSIGRLHWVKDYPLALKTLSHLKEEGIDFTYRIVGAGPELEHLLFLRNLYGLDKEVEFLGVQGAEKIASLLQQSHLFLVSSLAEGFSNVALEAQAFGLPCVVTGVSGMKDCVEEGKTGLILKDRRSKSFAQAIRMVLMNNSQFDPEYISARIKNTFSQQNQAQAWQKFFDEI